MRVLIVASYNSNRFSPFVSEQATALSDAGVDMDFFGIKGKGIKGYLSNRKRLLKKIKEFKPDLLHAHYGLSGLLANSQRSIPVVTTYHGSDIHSGGWLLSLSKLCMRFSAYNIFVGQNLFDIAKYKGKNYTIQSCGLDLSLVQPIAPSKARALLGWRQEDVDILFAGAFDNRVKNYALAKQSVERVGNCQLIELKGYTKEEVTLLMNACDLLLVTSFRESGPLVVKEAMACNRPVVTTDVGDVRWVMGNTDGCYITSYEVNDCAENIKKAIKFSVEKKETDGRKRVVDLGLDLTTVAKKIKNIYLEVVKK